MIRFFYEIAAQPFFDAVRKIEAEEPPCVPSYNDGDEPPFLAEWGDAQHALNLLGLAGLSLLSDSLKVYFRTWESELHIACQPNFKSDFKLGFVNGYKACIGSALSIDWELCPANLGIVEQVTLARNNAQHTNHIAMMGANHSDSDRNKYAIPYFLDESERNALLNWPDMPSWLNPEISVNRDTLLAAIAEVEKLCEWLEPKLNSFRYPD